MGGHPAGGRSAARWGEIGLKRRNWSQRLKKAPHMKGNGSNIERLAAHNSHASEKHRAVTRSGAILGGIALCLMIHAFACFSNVRLKQSGARQSCTFLCGIKNHTSSV